MSLDTITVKDGSGTNKTLRVVNDGSNNLSNTSMAVDSTGAELKGQKAMASSLPVVLASNQSSVPINDNSSSISVDDNGSSLTVDGTVAISGTVNVADGGGSLTVDGSVAATQSGTWNVETVSTVTTITNPVAVTDNSGSLTVDAPVSTPVFVRLSDGSSAITHLQVNTTQIGGNTINTGSGAAGAATQRVILATNSPGSSPIVNITTSITRPGDTTAYAANDTLANSTSAPTTGGFTFTGAAKASGLGGIINTAVITSTKDSTLQGEVWIFDSAVTAINDNAAFSLSDADAVKLVGIIPFTLSAGGVNNSQTVLTNLGMGYQCVGSANLRFLIKVLAAYTPDNAEVITVRINVSHGD